MSQIQKGRSVAALLLTISVLLLAVTNEAKGSPGKSNSRKSKSASKARPASSCSRCTGKNTQKGRSTRAKAKAKNASCHPKGYVDPKISRNLNAALRDMRRAGIKPVITSTWRSSQDQARLHSCSNSRRCRRLHPGLYRAMPPGRSLHEAGLAVDIAGVATGPRGSKRLTRRGRRIVQIMRRHGFSWRYGLADPVHFEVDPRRYGYRNASHAIRRSQSQCQMAVAAARKGRAAGKGQNIRSRQAARVVKSIPPQMRVTVKVESSSSQKRSASRT